MCIRDWSAIVSLHEGLQLTPSGQFGDLSQGGLEFVIAGQGPDRIAFSPCVIQYGFSIKVTFTWLPRGGPGRPALTHKVRYRNRHPVESVIPVLWTRKIERP